VVQDSFLRLCREEATAVQGHLAEWLYTVCRRRAIDLLRKEKRMTALSTERAERQESREGEQSLAAERADLMDGVARLLAGLSTNQQEVVRLKFQGGLSYREISNVTELSVTNVGYLLHTAIQKIRDGLEAHE
jgi:RNA polymerase sigma-70 factor (ECF subfamily)